MVPIIQWRKRTDNLDEAVEIKKMKIKIAHAIVHELCRCRSDSSKFTRTKENNNMGPIFREF